MFSLKEISALAGIGADCKQRLGSNIIIVSSKITCGLLLNLGFLPWGQLSLKLISNLFRNFTLNRKHVIERAIITFRPQMRVRSGVYQLHTYSYTIRRALHASLD